MNVASKLNRNKDTSANKYRVRVKEKTIANTRDLFRGSSTKLYLPASVPPPREGFHYALKIFSQKILHKGTIIVYTISEYTTPTLNPLHKR